MKPMSQGFNDDDLEKIDLNSGSGSDSGAEDGYDSGQYEDESNNGNGKNYSKGSDNYDEDDDSSGINKILQISVIFVICIILAAVAFLLIRWQRGKAPDAVDNNYDPSVDVESEDYFVPFDPTIIDGYVDDGEFNIVILGDDTIAHYQGEGSIPDLIAGITGANVTTVALNGSTVALRETSYTPEYAQDAFNLYYIIASVCGGDMGSYELMSEALNHIENNSEYYNYWDVIHKINFNKVDTLIINYGYSDYLAGRPLVGEEQYSGQKYGLENSVAGSLDDCLTMLQERFPYMQIIISSPSYCFVMNENGESAGADVYNTGMGTLGDYVINMKVLAAEKRVSFVDNYFFQGFNYAVYEDYLEEDGRFPNAEGRRLIAEHIAQFIYTGK